MKIALIACVKTKLGHPAPAKDLYTSQLFTGCRAYAEQHADRFLILSALHGVIDPDTVVEPYNVTLSGSRKTVQRTWAKMVAGQLATILQPGDELIVLAGLDYRAELLPMITHLVASVTVPLAGLEIGQQLAFLKAAAAVPDVEIKTGMLVETSYSKSIYRIVDRGHVCTCVEFNRHLDGDDTPSEPHFCMTAELTDQKGAYRYLKGYRANGTSVWRKDFLTVVGAESQGFLF